MPAGDRTGGPGRVQGTRGMHHPMQEREALVRTSHQLPYSFFLAPYAEEDHCCSWPNSICSPHHVSWAPDLDSHPPRQ